MLKLEQFKPECCKKKRIYGNNIWLGKHPAHRIDIGSNTYLLHEWMESRFLSKKAQDYIVWIMNGISISECLWTGICENVLGVKRIVFRTTFHEQGL